MFKNKKIIAIIPARGGSKSIPRKNIKPLNGKPLISYAINAARGSKYIDKVIVSTDDKEIAGIARKYKAEVPFIRPSDLAQDKTPMLPVLQHVIGYLEKEENYFPDIIILIHLTSPFLLSEDIDKGVEEIVNNKTNSCATLSWVHHRPEFMLLKKDKVFIPLLELKNRTTIRRQDFRPLYRVNGAFYVNTRNFLMKSNGETLDFDSISGVVIPQERSVDIDEPLDFVIAESVLRFNKKRP